MPELNANQVNYIPASPAWPYGTTPNTNFYGQMDGIKTAAENNATPGLSGQDFYKSGYSGANKADSFMNLPVDNSLLSKQNEQTDISLLDLLVKAELITETTLAATLKTHELVQSGRINSMQAVDLLKREHNKGDNIENYFDGAISFKESANKAQPNRQINNDPAIFLLLEQAGLISKADIKSAENVIKKYGGDVASVLQAANKLDEQTYTAAKIASELNKTGLMKLEQAVIILNYCSRSRVSFNEALNELNWPDPRKQATL